MSHDRARRALGIAAFVTMLDCTGEVIDFRRADAGAVAGSQTCASVDRGEPLDGLPCDGSEIRGNDCQTCQCHDGTLKCSEYICRDNRCPSRPPPRGGACESAGCICEYPNACGVPHVATCVQRQYRAEWSVSYAQCAPDCPATLPQAGSMCWDQYARCDYRSEDSGTTTHASCLGGNAGAGGDNIAGTWMVSADATEPGADACPGIEPSPGEDCIDKGLECFYQTECGAVRKVHCADSWQITHLGECQPPQCPVQQPHTGDACATPLLVGDPCSYAHGSSCETTCFCRSDHRYACYDICAVVAGDHSEMPGSGYAPPGALPPPWRQCDEHAWCSAVSASCGSEEHSCECTAQGWECD